MVEEEEEEVKEEEEGGHYGGHHVQIESSQHQPMLKQANVARQELFTLVMF